MLCWHDPPDPRLKKQNKTKQKCEEREREREEIHYTKSCDFLHKIAIAIIAIVEFICHFVISLTLEVQYELGYLSDIKKGGGTIMPAAIPQ